jgi:hypothetical protein
MCNPARPSIVRFVALAALAAICAHGNAATGTAATSESTVTISGAGIAGETYRLAQMYGDWFATATDAYAHLTMRTLPGAHQAQLGIEWNGTGAAHTIDVAKNDVHRNSNFSFSLHLTGAGAYGQQVELRGGDAITVNITHMDNLVLEATFSGAATGAGPLKIAGVIKLHRAAPAEQPTGNFGNCDPVIYDKLAGAEWRSPSECEVNFDAYARKGLTVALAPVVSSFTAGGWRVMKQVETQSLTSIPRHTESKPFQLNEQQMHQSSAFYVLFGLPDSSPAVERLNQAAMDQMQKAIAAAQAGHAVPMDAANDAARALDEASKIGITVAINLASQGISNFKGGHTVTQLAGGGFAVEAPYVQAPTGGDIAAAQRVTYVFVGAWAPPPASRPGGADEEILVKGALNPAKLLAVQNIRIRIQGSTANAQQVIRSIDWSALKALLAGN